MATQPSLNLLTFCSLFALLAWPGMAGYVLYSELGGKLASGESLVYKQYSLVMQKDCNLVLYDRNDPIWASNTYAMDINCFLTLESNGELIIHGYTPLTSSSSFVIWRNRATSVQGSYVLVLEYDGGLRVYGPAIWSVPSKSAELRSDGYGWHAVNESLLWTGDVAPIGTTIVNTVYKLALKDNCNLTLSDIHTGGVLWYTDTSNHQHDCFVHLDDIGVFRIKYTGGDTLWSSGVNSTNGAYVLVLSPNADLAVHGPSIWTAGKSAVVAVAGSADGSIPTGEKIVMVSKE